MDRKQPRRKRMEIRFPPDYHRGSRKSLEYRCAGRNLHRYRSHGRNRFCRTSLWTGRCIQRGVKQRFNDLSGNVFHTLDARKRNQPGRNKRTYRWPASSLYFPRNDFCRRTWHSSTLDDIRTTIKRRKRAMAESWKTFCWRDIGTG